MNWRDEIARPTLGLTVGGFRPTNEPTASCFGEVRLSLPNEDWPHLQGKPLWPLCQLNLLDASYKPDMLSDLALITLFIDEYYMFGGPDVINLSDLDLQSPWVIRTYPSLEGLIPVEAPNHQSQLRPFEALWSEETIVDYPTHDCLPIGFEESRVQGEYYEQEGIKTLYATKLGGWPSCAQSEPWWDSQRNEHELDFAFQIDSEYKSHWCWGDNGLGYFARSKKDPNIWGLDIQCY